MSQLITPWDILTSSEQHLDREKSDECTTQVRVKAADLAERCSKLFTHLGVRPSVSSGFRTSAANKAAGGAANSAHLTGEAADFEDVGQAISSRLSANPDLLVQFGLYMENPYYTKTWVHLSTRPTPSGRRIFTP